MPNLAAACTVARCPFASGAELTEVLVVLSVKDEKASGQGSKADALAARWKWRITLTSARLPATDDTNKFKTIISDVLLSSGISGGPSNNDKTCHCCRISYDANVGENTLISTVCHRLRKEAGVVKTKKK